MQELAGLTNRIAVLGPFQMRCIVLRLSGKDNQSGACRAIAGLQHIRCCSQRTSCNNHGSAHRYLLFCIVRLYLMSCTSTSRNSACPGAAVAQRAGVLSSAMLSQIAGRDSPQEHGASKAARPEPQDSQTFLLLVVVVARVWFLQMSRSTRATKSQVGICCCCRPLRIVQPVLCQPGM